jgi:hypothetical protein
MDVHLGSSAPALILLGPILVLWFSALILHLLDYFVKLEDRGIAEAGALLISLGFLIAVRLQVGRPLYLGPAVSASSERVPPFLIAGNTTWVLALILLGGAWIASLASLGQPAARGRSGRLAVLGAGLGFFFAGDWATLAMFWVLVDVCLLYTLVQEQARSLEEPEAGAEGGGEPSASETVPAGGARGTLGWTAVLSLGGAMALGLVILLWRHAGGGTWVDPYSVFGQVRSAPLDSGLATNLKPYLATLGVLVVLLRLMPFPLPSWHAHAREAGPGRLAERTPPLAQVVRLAIPTLLGAYLWTRLAQWGIVEQSSLVRMVLPWWAGLIMLVAGTKAWSAAEPGQLVACANDYVLGFMLLGMGLNLPVVWQLFIGVCVVLTACTLFVGWTQTHYLNPFEPHSYWLALPAAWALLSLGGIPLTAGFPARVGIYKALFAGERWPLLLLILAGEAAFLGALLRILFDVERVTRREGDQVPEEQQEDQEDLEEAEPLTEQAQAPRTQGAAWQREVRLGAGIALSLGVLILGTFPVLPIPGLGFWLTLPTLAIWAAWLLPLVGAAALYRSQDAILPVLEAWWPVIRRIFRLDRLYKAVQTALGYVGVMFWGGTQVVEGAGYMAWALLVCLVILLFILRG